MLNAVVEKAVNGS